MRVLAIVAATALLAGCTDADWAHVMSYTPVGATTEESAAPAPVQSATATGTPTAVSPTVAADAGSRPPTTMAAATGVSAKAQRDCLQWANARAGDATNQNFDDEIALKVRDATYADCMTWAIRLHR